MAIAHTESNMIARNEEQGIGIGPTGTQDGARDKRWMNRTCDFAGHIELNLC